MSIRVFNADDHPLLRKGVSDLLRETEGLQWVGSAPNGKEALDKIRALQPDVAILDIEMPHFTGLEVAQTLIQEGTKTSFILLTLFKDESFFRSALAIGVMGYLLKESSETEIINAIRSVHQKRPYVNPELTHLLINNDKGKNQFLEQLSEQEINILKLVAQQKTSKEIANMLFISPKTVSNHRTNISKKLDLGGVQNGLLKWALEHKEFLADN
ncbi:MAG: response regulator transcription factor [Saprospiraceae bacterium]